MPKFLLLLLVMSMGLVSCLELPEGRSGLGMEPIYASPDDFSAIQTVDIQPNVDQGAFASDGDFLYINERFKGIHVYDNTDLNNPEKVHFWNIPGNSEFTVDGNLLYADNSRHLITIDISDKANIKYVSHVKDIYTGDQQNNNFPENYRGIFECVDFEKGIVIEWKQVFVEDVDCMIN